MRDYLPLGLKQYYKFRLGYHPTVDKQEAQALKVAVGKEYPKHYTVRHNPYTLNRKLLCGGDNFPFVAFVSLAI